MIGAHDGEFTDADVHGRLVAQHGSSPATPCQVWGCAPESQDVRGGWRISSAAEGEFGPVTQDAVLRLPYPAGISAAGKGTIRCE